MLRTIPNSNTNGTIATQATDILDTPGHRTARSRLSFLQRKPVANEQHEAKEAVLVNGNGNRKSGRGRGDSEDGSERSRSKENRRSFFGGSGGVGSLGSIGRGRGREIKGEDEGSEWVTQSDLSTARRSSSEVRPKTGKSEKSAGNLSKDGLSREGSVGSRVGSVRKRLSRLTLGKKASKASVLVGSVAEEE
jgi:hypothetical protein